MTKIILPVIVLVSLGAIVFVRAKETKAPVVEYSDPISQMLETIRVKHNLPALAAAVAVDGKVVMTDAVGFRKNGGPEKVTADDQFHLAGERGESKLLKAESFKKLHTAMADNYDYALGWVVMKRGWAKGRELWHNGSNTMFYVVVWLAPDQNCAVIVASNIGGDDASKGCDEIAVKLINQYFGK